MAEAGRVSGQGKGAGDGNRGGWAAVLGSISACVFWLVCFFSGATHSLGGAKPRADERSEKVRRLSGGSVSNSEVLSGNLAKRLPFLVLQVLCRLPLELDERLR